MMFLIEKDGELTNEYLVKVLQQFQTQEVPALNRLWNYYSGKQKILNKKAVDGKPCNKIVTNYCYNITQNYLGYITGVPIKYRNDEFSDVIDILSYNDVTTEDSELLKNALIFGVAYECNYLDEEGQTRFRLFDSREAFPIYDNTLNNDLVYVVRFYKEDLLNKLNDNYYVEVYGPDTIRTYKATSGFSSVKLIGEVPHYFSQCPVSVFKLNEEERGIFEQIIPLQDGYNEMVSDEVDDFDAFADAYLVLKGMTADEDDLKDMKKNRVLIMDNDASAEYLTKSFNDTQVNDMLKNFNDQIHKIANSPDFNDEKFMAQSGIAMRYKLVGFENAASAIEQQMRKCLQRRIELIAGILNLKGAENVWRDVEIVFTRNLPNMLEPSTIDELMKLKGLVSDETLLGQLPFIRDVDEELEKVKAQTEANMSLYSFNRELEDGQLLDEQRSPSEV